MSRSDEDDRKCWVGRLPQDISEDEILQIFNTYGKVTNVSIHEKGTQRFAFVTYDSKRGSAAACQVLNEVYRFREDSKDPILCRPPRKKGFEQRPAGPRDDRGGYERGGHHDRGYERDGGHGRGREYSMRGNNDPPPHRRGYDDRNGGYGYDRGGGGGGGGGYPARSSRSRERDRFERERYDHRPPPREAPREYRDRGGRDRDRGERGDRGGYDRGYEGGYDRGARDAGYDRGARSEDRGRGSGGGSRVPPSAKLYVENLPEDITKDAMDYVFSRYGRVQDIHIMNNRSAQTHQSCAFVRYSSPHDARKCVLAMEQGYEIRPGEGEITVKFAEEGRSRGKGKGREEQDRGRPY